MNARRTAAVALKVLRTIRRDRRTLALVLVAPVLAMIVFGFVFGTEVNHVPVAVVNEDGGGANATSARILANLDAEKVEQRSYATWEEAQAAVRDAKVRAAIRFPADFTENTTARGLAPPPGANITYYLDASNSQVAGTVTGALLAAIQKTLTASLEARGVSNPVAIETEHAYAKDARFIDFFVPGIMSFAALVFTTLLAILAFVGERTSGTLSRLLVTPVRTSEIVAGYAAAFGLLAIAQGAIILSVALFAFEVLVVGSLAIVVLVVVLMSLVALFLGISLSAFARRESQAIQFFPLIIFPTFLLSGIFVPVESLPPWLAPLAWAIPPTWAVEALRDVMLRGWGLDRVGVHILALTGFAVGFLLLAVLGLRGARAAR